jgi:hypothetical protein
MPTIPLNRQFYEWKAGESDLLPRYRALAGLSKGLLYWQDLLAKKRVVILAEAGSGKTEELKEQARLQTVAGKFSVYATVQDVGRDGLAPALKSCDQNRLSTWQQSNEPGWFFIDSIDEAKLERIQLETALRKLANSINGAQGRAHIVLSGRHTDWEPERDAQRLNEELPIPQENPAEQSPSLRTLIRRVLDHEEKPAPLIAETPLIVVMAPLNTDQVRAYGAAKGIQEIDQLMAEIDAKHLEKFVCRPLDLDWIVQSWQTHQQVGSFTQMIKASLEARSKETKPSRDRRSSLNFDLAMRGLERIGAALVFGRKTAITIPDEDAGAGNNQAAIKLESVLPDWSGAHRQEILVLPAFDPATFGQARLHNDNDGEVRAYLAARWLHRLSQSNLSQRELHGLLFSQTYGIKLVRPSMRETAAWLSLWDTSVASEVIRREPFVLFTGGDPAGLCASTRKELLMALTKRICQGQKTPWLDHRSLTRFAQPDIAQTLQTIWETGKENADIRHLVLNLIELGALKACADLAKTAAFGQYGDINTSVFAGRALIAAGDDTQRRAYADYIKQGCTSIPSSVVGCAVEDLFPKFIDVADLLAILAVIDFKDKQGGGFGLDYKGARLVKKLKDPGELTKLTNGLLQQLEVAPIDENADRSPKECAYAATLVTAAQRWLDQADQSVAPDAVIDALLYVGKQNFDGCRGQDKEWRVAFEQLHQTSARRQAAFWRAAGKLGSDKKLRGNPLVSLSAMSNLGWPINLLPEDIEWLLIDGPKRQNPNERCLAINAALNLWHATADKPESVKAQIATVAATDTEMQKTCLEFFQSLILSADQIESAATSKKLMDANENARSIEEQDWINFIEKMKANPEQLRQPQPTKPTTVDGHIYNLWQLLDIATRQASSHAINNVAPIAEIASPEVAKAFAEGLAVVWRAWVPTLNGTTQFDLMCLTGVSLEAVSRTDWALHLTEEQATRATELASLELNGFPVWIAALASKWPKAVEKVLSQKVRSALDSTTPNYSYDGLGYIDRADESVVRLMAPVFWRELQVRSELNQLALKPLLEVLTRGLSEETSRQELNKLVLSRFHTEMDPQISVEYLRAAYAINEVEATDALIAKLDLLGANDQTALVERVLPQIFGSRSLKPIATSFEIAALERLVVLAFRTVRIEDDHQRAGQGMYSPDSRDAAENARSSAFNQLANKPGQATFDALQRLMKVPGFPIPASHLDELAMKRAAEDSERAAWQAEDTYQFEQQREKQPETSKELQELVLQRLEDLQYELIHGDYQQGSTLSALPTEPDVQKWMSKGLENVQKNAYSVGREGEVADGKKPDILLVAKTNNAEVAIEIKVIESWSLAQLEEALVKQLCEQYLRTQNRRHGILLLVYLKLKPRGWRAPDGTYLKVEDVVKKLRDCADQIKSQSPTGPQPEVQLIDVSSCHTKQPSQYAQK